MDVFRQPSLPTELLIGDVIFREWHVRDSTADCTYAPGYR